jgi:endonuclease/exonuclease/phosphatase (EEP) superfamily protein YafD
VSRVKRSRADRSVVNGVREPWESLVSSRTSGVARRAQAGPRLVWVLAAGVAAWAAVRLIGAEGNFAAVLLVAYTPYAVVAAMAVVLIAVAMRSWPAAAVAAASAVALVVVVAPRVIRDDGTARGSGSTLRVLSINANLGRASAPAVVALVRRERVDILSIQELTPPMAAALRAAKVSAQLPHSVVRVRPGAAGTGLYARLPLQQDVAPAGTTFAMVAARAYVLGAAAVTIVAVHAAAPRRSRDVAMWRRDLRALPPRAVRGPLRILAGDFNATLDHRELRNVLDTGYRDAAAETGAGLEPTWPSEGLVPPPVSIDHVLADGRCAVRRVAVRAVARSDHRAVLAELVLPRGAG